MTAQFFSSEEYDRQASELLEAGDPAGAAAMLREGLGIFPSTPELRLNLGQAYLQMEEWALASREFLSALTLAPADVDANRGLAVSLLRLGRIEEALEALDAACAGIHGDEQSCLQIAEALLAADRSAEGLEFACRALVVEPDSADAELLRGLAMHALGMGRDDKYRALRRALDLDPGRWDIIESFGHICFEDGDLRQALRFFELLPVDHIDSRMTLERLEACYRKLRGGRVRLAACRDRLDDVKKRDELWGWPPTPDEY